MLGDSQNAEQAHFFELARHVLNLPRKALCEAFSIGVLARLRSVSFSEVRLIPLPGGVERPGLIFARGVVSKVRGATPFPGAPMHETPHVLTRGPF